MLEVLGAFHRRHGLLLLLLEERTGGLVLCLQIVQLLEVFAADGDGTTDRWKGTTDGDQIL